jgi:hypothetical protein
VIVRVPPHHAFLPLYGDVPLKSAFLKDVDVGASGASGPERYEHRESFPLAQTTEG